MLFIGDDITTIPTNNNYNLCLIPCYFIFFHAQFAIPTVSNSKYQTPNASNVLQEE
jgi:hypothetical protein